MATSDDATRGPKPVFWMALTRKALRGFPKPVRLVMGQALFDAQTGNKHPDAKPLRGFGGAAVLEVVEDHDGNSYRAIYTIRFAGAVYVLHAFQKKSKKGVKTPTHEMATVKARLKAAERHYAEWIAHQTPRD